MFSSFRWGRKHRYLHHLMKSKNFLLSLLNRVCTGLVGAHWKVRRWDLSTFRILLICFSIFLGDGIVTDVNNNTHIFRAVMISFLLKLVHIQLFVVWSIVFCRFFQKMLILKINRFFWQWFTSVAIEASNFFDAGVCTCSKMIFPHTWL